MDTHRDICGGGIILCANPTNCYLIALRPQFRPDCRNKFTFICFRLMALWLLLKYFHFSLINTRQFIFILRGGGGEDEVIARSRKKTWYFFELSCHMNLTYKYNKSVFGSRRGFNVSDRHLKGKCT